MKIRVPDIYIIGAQKSGTTTLYDWLSQHPEIYAHPLAKDYSYFSDDKTYNDGLGLFYFFSRGAHDHQIVLGGEANSMYAPPGPQRMREIMPSSRLIAILRNPVDRAFSAYCHAVERVMEERLLEQAIDDELAGVAYKPEDARRRDYLAHGQYARQLRRICQYFNSEQIKVVIFEELKKEPLEVLQKIFQFADIRDDFVPDMQIKNKTKGGSRSKILAKILHRRPSSRVMRGLGRTLIPFSVRTNIRRKLVVINRIEQSKPDFPKITKRLLVNYYRNEITELESFLGRRIPSWHE